MATEISYTSHFWVRIDNGLMTFLERFQGTADEICALAIKVMSEKKGLTALTVDLAHKLDATPLLQISVNRAGSMRVSGQLAQYFAALKAKADKHKPNRRYSNG